MSVCDGAEIEMVATAALLATVSCAVPLLPSLVAVTVSVPVDTPVTSPLVLIVPTAAGDALQVTARPESVLPEASRGDAENCSVCETVTDCPSGVTLTVATDCETGGVGPPSPPLPPHAAARTRSAADSRG